MSSTLYDPETWSELHWEYEPVSLPTPAAGSALTYTAPTATEQLVICVSFLFTTSNAVATRVPYMAFLDQSGTSIAEIATPYTFTASNAGQVTFGLDVQQFGANNGARIGCAIPPVVLADGMQFKLTAALIDTADTITKARMYVKQRGTALS